MINLSEFTDEELEAEVERRKRGDKPKMLQISDISKLIGVCQKYIDYVDSDEYPYGDDFWDHHIYATAIETFFGKDVWNWINDRE